MKYLLAAVLLVGAPLAAQARHVIFVTIDGVRVEDLFGGADPSIMADAKGAGIDDTAAFRARWWRESPIARRRAMMPFLWDTLVPMGVLFGEGDGVRVTNGLQFSGPGYTELFTGAPRADVTSNADVRQPHPTLFEVLAREPGRAATDVAAFTSWTTQARLADSRGGTFTAQAPFDPLPAALGDEPRLVRLHEIEQRVHHDDTSIRYDAFTHEMALAWLTRFHPVLLHVGYGETDVDAHARRYDRYLEMLHLTDRMLSELWHAAQADPALAGRTALIVTTDHGRGATSRDWTDHGRDVTNAAHWWFLAAGAGVTPRGAVADPMVQAQTAPTILRLLGRGVAGLEPPVAQAVDLAPTR